MIAAVRRRQGKAGKKAERALAAAPIRLTRRADRAANRALERAHPPLRRAGQLAGTGFDAVAAWIGARLRWVGRRLRPGLILLLRGLARLDAWTRRGLAAAARAATAASAVATPRRAVGTAIAVAGALLIVSQFVDYHAVEIGQPDYAGLPDVARPPTVDSRTAGQAHAYLLVPVGVAAVALGLVCARGGRRRWGLAAAALGLVGIAVALAVDLPQGLDAGSQGSRFEGVVAVLEDGFYAELAAAAMLVIAGLVYYARPCRIRISSSGRAASARRRRPRRRASSRARVARSA
ncbi:MAG: hypothetical protein R2725_01230 [Solirubrobacterales bacterium]